MSPSRNELSIGIVDLAIDTEVPIVIMPSMCDACPAGKQLGQAGEDSIQTQWKPNAKADTRNIAPQQQRKHSAPQYFADVSLHASDKPQCFAHMFMSK